MHGDGIAAALSQFIALQVFKVLKETLSRKNTCTKRREKC